MDEGKDYEYAEYIVHSYYTECHELYSYTVSTLEFVSDAMPLFGLIGTILGLIAMFDGLGADVSIESLTPQLALALKTTLYGAVFSSFYKIISARFDQRLAALDYDVQHVNKGFKVIIANRNRVEVR
jgi:chemotaxis protein MotA